MFDREKGGLVKKMLVAELEQNRLFKEFLKLLDDRLCILMFCKTHRPIEKAKLDKIDMKLNFYRRKYPGEWQEFQRLMETF